MPASNAQQLTAALEDLIVGVLERYPELPGLIVEIEGPVLRYRKALGLADASGTALTLDHPVRLASNTKTYVAAALLRLMEEGRVALDDAIARHLSAEPIQVLTSGGYDVQAITLRHLLTHTSGLYDYSDSADFDRKVRARTHSWTRLQQLEDAMTLGDAYGPPGEVFRYSDTGYILLAEILEQVTQTPHYGAALRQLLPLEPLGLAHTWLEVFEEPPADLPPRAHQYLEGISNIDQDATADLFGGGGLVATLADLLTFHRALFHGQVYRQPKTLEVMLSTVAAKRGGPIAYDIPQVPGQYRMGLFVLPRGGLTAYLHGGYYGTEAVHFPEIDVTLALTVNTAESDAGDELVEAVARLLVEHAHSASPE
ncbi:MAG: serine hydrolase domain-containing protein [Pseudomonadota bacterium]